jgi:hypothetical protein
LATESIEKAEKMSKLIRERNQREVYADDYYIEAIRHSQKELEESLLFLQRALAEPKRLFTEAKEGLHSTRSMIFKAIDYRARDQKMGNQHDFQALLADKMNQVIQEWVQDRGIEGKVRIEVRTPLSFPSIFCVYYDDMEIIQFNIFEQWYGVRQKPYTEQEMIQQNEITIENHEKQIQEFKTKLDNYKKYGENPWKYVKTPMDVVIILFKNQKLTEGLEKRISNTQKRLKEEEETLQGVKEGFPYYLNKARQERKGIDEIIPFFEELSYRLETQENKLY